MFRAFGTVRMFEMFNAFNTFQLDRCKFGSLRPFILRVR